MRFPDDPVVTTPGPLTDRIVLAYRETDPDRKLELLAQIQDELRLLLESCAAASAAAVPDPGVPAPGLDPDPAVAAILTRVSERMERYHTNRSGFLARDRRTATATAEYVQRQEALLTAVRGDLAEIAAVHPDSAAGRALLQDGRITVPVAHVVSIEHLADLAAEAGTSPGHRTIPVNDPPVPAEGLMSAQLRAFRLRSDIVTASLLARALRHDEVGYADLDWRQAVVQGLAPDSLLGPGGQGRHAFNGEIRLQSVPEDPERFQVVFTSVPQSACLDLATQDWPQAQRVVLSPGGLRLPADRATAVDSVCRNDLNTMVWTFR